MELVWAKVPGWSWWPAVVLPVPENGRETRGNKAIIKVEDNERVVLFLVDKTVARVPRELPAFTQHYTRFLSATYANKKLFQAVEEARALVYEGSVAAAHLKEAEQLSMISYPPPVRDDFRKSGRQLLQWLKAAAVDPAAPVNKLSDQANKRVLHAVHNNRRVTEDMKPFVLPPEVPAAVAPAAAVHAGNQGPAVAETTTEQLPAKRQRRPHSWLQQYGDLPPALAQSTTAAAAQQPPAGSKTAGAGGSAAGGGAAAASRQGPANGYTLAGKANGQLARLKQMSTKVRNGQQGKAAAADSELLANGRSKGRKRARSTTVDGHDAADDSGSDEEGQDYALLSDSNSDDDVERPLQQRRPQDRALCASAAQKALSMTHCGPAEQQNPRGKQRRLMDLMALCESAKSGGVSKAAAAAAAVAAAFRGGRSADCDPAAAGSSGVDEGHNSRPQAGSKGSGTRMGRKQQQQQVRQQDSDSESDVDSDLLDCRDARGLSGDATGRAFSRLKQRQPESVYGGLQRRYSMQQQPQRARAGIIPAVVNGDLRCYSPQLLRQSGPSAASRCTCGCCYCQQHRRQQQEQQRLQQQRQQHAALDSAVDQVLGDWLQSDQDMLNATDGLQQHQQPMAGEADGGDSLVDVQAFADRGLLSSTQEDCLASPASLITAAGAPLRPTAVRLAGAGSNRACSIPHLRPPSPLLGAAPVMTVGDELLPGLEEDLQHAAAIFGSSSGKESSCQPGQQQQQSDGEPPGQQNQCEEVIAGAAAGAAAAAVEGYMSDGASAAAAAADSPGLIDLDLQPTLLTDDAVDAAAAAGSMHPDSPSTASHDTLLLPSWELDVIKTGPQDSELQAEIAAAAAASSAGAAKAGAAAAAAVEIPPVLGFRRSVSQRSASSTGDDVRRLALARCNSSNKTPDLQTQLEDCKEQLHASTEIVRQLKQQLDAKDDQIAALCSQTSAQAKQLQQQAGELMALRALLGKQQKLPANAGVTTTTAVTAAAASDAPSGVQQTGKDSSGATAAAEAQTAGATDQTEQAAAPVDHGGDAASAPVRRSGRLSAAAARAAVRDLLDLSDAAVAGTTDGVSMLAGGQQQQQQQTDVSHLQDKDACSDPRELQQQLHQANTLITNLQKQLQQATKQATAATKQQQAEAEQLRSWLQAAEIDAALVRSENELLKKALPSSVVASVAATAACKPADKATAGRARSKASEGGSSGRKQSGGRPSAAGKAGVAVKGKAAAGAAVEGNASATAARGPAAASATAQQVATLAAAAASTPTSPLAAAAANKACNVFSRRPKMQLPLQTIALPTSNAANAQTLAAALAALKDATAGSNAISVGNSSSSSTLTIPASLATTTTTVSSPTAASTGTALLSLAAAAGGAGVANVGGPVVVFRPSGALQLATMLQVNAALSQLAALNAAGANKPAAAAAAVAPLVLKPPTPCSPPPPAAAATAAAAAGCSANPTAASGSNAAATGSTTSAAGGGGIGCRSSSRPAVLMLGDTPPPSTSNGSVLTAVRACTNTHSDKAGSMQAVQKTGTAAPAGLVLSKAASAAAVAGVVGAAKATDSQAI